MRTGRQIGLKWLLVAVIAGFLASSSEAQYGQFYMTNVSIVVSDEDTISIQVIATSQAKFSGAPDPGFSRWDLNAGIREAYGTYSIGYGTHGNTFGNGMVVNCPTTCGGGERVDKCTSSGGPNAYNARGSVVIDHNILWNDIRTTLPVQTECLESPPGGNEPHEGQGTDCENLVLDLDRNGFHLTNIEDSVRFDIDADGELEEISWTRAGQLDGFLVIDRNANGLIDDGLELFNSHTSLQNGKQARSGYEALAELDGPALGGNGDGVLDARDEFFYELRIWVDFDHDGISQQAELLTLEQKGVTRIDLAFSPEVTLDGFGNRLRDTSRAWVEGPGLTVLPVKTSFVRFATAEAAGES